jgi:hypothetical protein
MKHILLSTLAASALSVAAWAQTSAPPLPPPPPPISPDQPTFFFYQSATPIQAFHADMKPVLNSPYQAQIATETTQHLSDGNVIQNSHTSKVARDSQGRTWREETIQKFGPWASNSGPETIIFISDPVAKVSYVLHPDTKTAEKMPSPGMMSLSIRSGEAVADGATAGAVTMGEAGSMAKTVIVQQHGALSTSSGTITSSIEANDKNDTTTEDLGTQQVNGVAATGKRVTHTTPANTIGNQLPIVTVDETWYSPDLKTVVQSKHDDPRFGENTFSLTNIQKGEPPADLFQLPADYTVSSGPSKRPLPLNQ